MRYGTLSTAKVSLATARESLFCPDGREKIRSWTNAQQPLALAVPHPALCTSYAAVAGHNHGALCVSVSLHLEDSSSSPPLRLGRFSFTHLNVYHRKRNEPLNRTEKARAKPLPFILRWCAAFLPLSLSLSLTPPSPTSHRPHTHVLLTDSHRSVLRACLRVCAWLCVFPTRRTSISLCLSVVVVVADVRSLFFFFCFL